LLAPLPGVADGLRDSSRLPRERQPPDAPGTIAGALAYIAPEQTGPMNRWCARSTIGAAAAPALHAA